MGAARVSFPAGNPLTRFKCPGSAGQEDSTIASAITPARRGRLARCAIPRRAFPLLLVGAGLLLGASERAWAGDHIYAYVDSRGVSHFTDVPKDARYVRIHKPKGRYTPSVGAPQYRGYDGLIRLSAREHDIPPALIKAVIAAESSFDSAAVSRVGAQGLMQLMPHTAAALGVADPFVAEENVRGGTRYLREMLDRYGELRRALAAYNAGPDVVDRYRGIPPYPETRDYVKRVLTYYRGYHGDFGP